MYLLLLFYLYYFPVINKYLNSLVTLWSSFEVLFWILCQAILGSPLIWAGYKRFTVFLWWDFASPILLDVLFSCRFLHIWKSCHLYQTLCPDFSRESLSLLGSGTLECPAGCQAQRHEVALGLGGHEAIWLRLLTFTASTTVWCLQVLQGVCCCWNGS